MNGDAMVIGARTTPAERVQWMTSMYWLFRPTANKTSASVSQVEKSTSQTSNTNVEMPRVEYVRPSEVINEDWGNPQQALKNQGIFESGCSMHMTVNKDFLTDYQELDGGFVAFGGSARGELKFNLFSVSQMRDKKNSVLFTKTECLVLSLDFKLLDESQVLLRVPRQSNMYSKLCWI
ncbi:hypothetical protein Tco_1237925 [Tanacetum coccineum]